MTTTANADRVVATAGDGPDDGSRCPGRGTPGAMEAINLDAYYRGLAAERLQELGDAMLALSREAEAADAHDAAWHLADVATQLLDMGLEMGGNQTPRAEAGE